jgi:lysophospholipase L1-like esterase
VKALAFALPPLVLLALGVPGHAVAASAPMQVFIASDSTAAEYLPELYPQLGWGMVLKCAFGDNVNVRNYAKNGRSSKSFISEGFFAQIENEIRTGDTLLIQFGHNDSKADDPARFTEPEGDYKTWLSRYLDMARAKGAQAVLITPVTRRKFEKGVLVDTHAAYAKALRDLAAATHTPLIDLTADSMRWVSALGDEGSKHFFLVYTPADRIARFPDGNTDNTHFSEMGARHVAELVAQRLEQLKLPVSKRVKKMRPGLTRDTPLGGPTCTQPLTEKPSP